MDDIWNHGFAYNISIGMIPYRDFNMIVTPLFSYLLSIIILILGKSIFSLHLLNSLISTCIMLLLIKRHNKISILFIPILIYTSFCYYNMLTLLLFILFIDIYNSKYKDNQYLIGFIVALILLTKQTVGGLIFIASFILSKNKRAYLIGFIPLCIIFLSYLFFTNSLYNFFDYCLFGMIDFTTGNGFNDLSLHFIFFAISLVEILFLLFKDKFKDKELIFILLYQIMALPLFDINHIVNAIIPFSSYTLKHKKNIIINKLMSIILLFSSFYMTFVIMNLFMTKEHIYKNDKSFLYNQYLTFDMNLFVYDLKEEIDDNYKDYDVFHLHTYAYLYKLETNEKINKYDLNNRGNMGYNGENKWIKEIDNYCEGHRCLLILDHYKEDSTQLSYKINDYVIKNYSYAKTLNIYDLYTN